MLAFKVSLLNFLLPKGTVLKINLIFFLCMPLPKQGQTNQISFCADLSFAKRKTDPFLSRLFEVFKWL
jgi:hypothetical protein